MSAAGLASRVGVCAAMLLANGCRAKESSQAAARDGGWAGLSFVEDDYEGALARARKEHRLLFVDAWAPWCHSCISMKAFVFNDPVLAPLASKFVWASVDTEKPKSESFVRKYPMKNWPTLWVVDGGTEKPVLQWVGSVTAPELAMLLESATQETTPAAAGAAEAAAAWLRGNHEAAEGKRENAIAEYESALARAPAAWAGRARLVDALSYQLKATKRDAACVTLGLREWPALGPGTPRVDVAVATLGCAESLAQDAPERPALAALAKEAARVAVDPKEPVLADDRSSLFESLVDYDRANGAAAEGTALARQWRDFLDAEAARAPTPLARSVFDSHRIGAYDAVGEPERAIPMLEQSERDFPDDYNPPARLAKGLLEAKKKPAEAKTALTRAIALGEKLDLQGGYQELLDRIRARAKAL